MINIILVEPQMGENIGAAARAMSNFGLCDLRIVAPRDGWPSDRATKVAAGGKFILDAAVIFSSLSDAIADLNYVVATTASHRALNKPVFSPQQALDISTKKIALGDKVGIIFGRERTGLFNEEITMCDSITTIPTSDFNMSLNLAQAVCVIGYEYSKSTITPNSTIQSQATKEEIELMLLHLQDALIEANHFKVLEMKPIMVQNIKNIFYKAQLTSQEVRTLRGMIKSLSRKSL